MNLHSRVIALLLAVVVGCRESRTDETASAAAADPVAIAASPIELAFKEVTEPIGLDFRHHNGMTGEFYIVEMMGSGGALFDYDNDGDLDLYLRQGGLLDSETGSRSDFRDRLFRNDVGLDTTQTPIVLVDVSENAGIEDLGYGMGVAVGDYDGDGWADLYLTNFGANRLLRNKGDGTFSDVTKASGTDDPRWSVPATFADFDADGRLDLYVGNYIDFTPASHKTCRRASSAPDYCGPMSYEPEPDRLLRNRGDGTFEDVTLEWGLSTGFGSALGALVGDFDGNGRLDLYVANDAMENQLWLGQTLGGFVDEAQVRGCAVNGRGEREGSMGISAGDFDRDGDEDIFITHMATESNTLYVNEGDGMFRDGSLRAGLATVSRPFTGFGTLLFDYDLDGYQDILVVNGAVRIIDELEAAGDPFPLHQTNKLFRNRGDGSFADASPAAGELTSRSEVSRGAVFGDVDNDGDADVVVVNNNGPARMYLNRAGDSAHWVGIAAGPWTPQSDLATARIELSDPVSQPVTRRLRITESYAAANDPRGVLAAADGSMQILRIHWLTEPGATELRGLAPGLYYAVAGARWHPGRAS